MGNPQAAESTTALRSLPSTDELMLTPAARQLLSKVGRKRLTTIARNAIDETRRELLENISAQASSSKDSLLAAAVSRMESAWDERQHARLRKVINATGVVIHTNLGRAPLADEAIAALNDAAGYTTLEYDLTNAKRGRRGASVEDILIEITGAEAALVVNNCAAAAFLVLTVFSKGFETIVSRGELVEIGGDFRIPDVLAESGGTLVEVGTTNRTKIADYERAIRENTRVILRVHPSNYRIVGFTEKPSLSALAELSHRTNVLLYEDAGSGALLDLSSFGLIDEPLISRSIAEGADVVTFSGDKLLGGSQAGLIVGRRDPIEQIRKHPLYRALRVDKLTYAVLQATMESFLRDDAVETVPVLRMLALTKKDLDVRVRDLAAMLAKRTGTASIEILDGDSVVGGGSAPAVRLETVLLAVKHPTLSAEEIEQELRTGDTPVIARIENNNVLIDLRTVAPKDENYLLDALAAAIN